MIDRLKVSIREGARDPWRLITLGVFVVCLAARLVLLDADTLDFDSYYMMSGVEMPFFEYLAKMAGIQLPMIVHYWVSYRLFGGELSDYLILPVAASLATVVVIYVGLNRYWTSATGIVFFTLCLYAVNDHSLYLASYGMFAYAFSLLVSSVLYFTFLHFSSNLHARIRWYWIPIAIIPAAFFSNLITTIPVLSGIASVLLYRWYRVPDSRNVKHVLHYLDSIWPLLLFPITYVVIYTLFPFTNLGSDKRPDMAEYFFYSSSNVRSLWGMGSFLIRGTANLLWQLFSPSPPAVLVGQHLSTYLRPILSILLLGLLCAWACVRLKILKCSNNSFKLALFTESPQMAFTLIYIGVMYSAIAVGGLSGLYPFGTVRYAGYLLIPALILVGYFFSWATINISSYYGVNARWRKVFLGLATFLVVLGVVTIASNHNKYMQDRAEINSVFESISHTDAELVLVGDYPAPALRHFVPSIYDGNKAMSIGWGTFWGHGSDGGVPQELTERIKGDGGAVPAVKRTLVIASSRQQFDEIYPSYSQMIGKYYRLEQEMKATNIWAGTYIKK